MGRLTLNPIAHIDLIGTILLPALLIISNAPFLFGYAKPVPVNFQNLNNPKRDMVWVALAGPAMNLLLALGCVLVLKFGLPLIASGAIHSSSSALVEFLSPVALMAKNGVLINIVLAVFNALPLPPLDGGRVAVDYRTLLFDVGAGEPYGFLILIILMTTADKIIGPRLSF
jgi:Zn-dependent protease